MNEIPPASARVWFITGCSSGLGLALATEVLEAGGRVVATAREASSISQLSARVSGDLPGDAAGCDRFLPCPRGAAAGGRCFWATGCGGEQRRVRLDRRL